VPAAPGERSERKESCHVQVAQQLLVARGILAIAIGIPALAWPRVTVLALINLFAVYVFPGSGLEAMQAFTSRKAGPVFGHLLLSLVDLAAGLVAVLWPVPTALVLVLIVGVWAVIAGLAEFFTAFQRGEPAGTRAMYILGGLECDESVLTRSTGASAPSLRSLPRSAVNRSAPRERALAAAHYVRLPPDRLPNVRMRLRPAPSAWSSS
jgi:uncharacterized membrane protein HdeD (DUF308 family)